MKVLHIALLMFISQVKCSSFEDVALDGSLYDLSTKAISEVTALRSAVTELKTRFSLFSQLINTTLAVRLIDLTNRLTDLLEGDFESISTLNHDLYDVTSDLNKEILQMVNICNLDPPLQNLELELKGDLSIFPQLAAIQLLLPNITDTFWRVQGEVHSTAGHIKAVVQETIEKFKEETTDDNYDLEGIGIRLTSILTLFETERMGQETAKIAMDKLDIRVQSAILKVLTYISPDPI